MHKFLPPQGRPYVFTSLFTKQCEQDAGLNAAKGTFHYVVSSMHLCILLYEDRSVTPTQLFTRSLLIVNVPASGHILVTVSKGRSP